MATTTVDSAEVPREISANPTYWLILVALVVLIAVGYSTRTTTTDTLSEAPGRVPPNEYRVDQQVDYMSTYPMNNLGLPWQENGKNNLNRSKETSPSNPNYRSEPGTRN